MDNRERISDPEEALRVAMEGMRTGLWTSMPGFIESFDPSTLTATVQLTIKGVVTGADGRARFVNMPLLVDVPVHFPRGGNCTLTFPVAQGDECLVVFAARCIDSWWQSGGVQVPMEPRMHDLSDGFAFVGFFSQATKIGGISTVSAQLRSNDGNTYVDLNPSAGTVKIVAPGGVEIDSSLSISLNAPNIVLNGNVSQGSGSYAGTTTWNGNMDINGILKNNGKVVGSTHTHGGVQPGSGNSGVVN